MNIYSSDAHFFNFDVPYDAKYLLNDSITRTRRGYSLIWEGAVLTGCGNVLLGRVESITAFALVALSSPFLILGLVITTPCFIIPTSILNLASRIPGISSFQSVQNFTKSSSNVIYRILKVNLIAFPVIFIFLSASTVNIFLPGILKSQNIFLNSIHGIVKSLGPLQTIRAIVPGVKKIVGTEKELSALAGVEEYFRALSYQNYLTEITVSHLTYRYSYSRSN